MAKPNPLVEPVPVADLRVALGYAPDADRTGPELLAELRALRAYTAAHWFSGHYTKGRPLLEQVAALGDRVTSLEEQSQRYIVRASVAEHAIATIRVFIDCAPNKGRMGLASYRWLLPRIAGVLQDHGRDAFPRVDECPNVRVDRG